MPHFSPLWPVQIDLKNIGLNGLFLSLVNTYDDTCYLKENKKAYKQVKGLYFSSF